MKTAPSSLSGREIRGLVLKCIREIGKSSYYAKMCFEPTGRHDRLYMAAYEVTHHLHESDVLLSKARYESCKMQGQYLGYKSSLGPGAPDAVIDYLAFDYPDLAPAAAQVAALLSGKSPTCVLRFK